MNLIFISAFLLILLALGAAGYFMLRPTSDTPNKHEAPSQGPKNRMVWALSARIGLSVLLFICVLLAWKLGYIKPTGLPLAQ